MVAIFKVHIAFEIHRFNYYFVKRSTLYTGPPEWPLCNSIAPEIVFFPDFSHRKVGYRRQINLYNKLLLAFGDNCSW